MKCNDNYLMNEYDTFIIQIIAKNCSLYKHWGHYQKYNNANTILY